MSLEQRRAVYNVDGQALTFVKAESYKGPLLVNTFGAYTLELRFSREWKEFDRIALYLQAAGAAGITLDLKDPLNAQKLSETDTQVIYLVNVPSQILKSIGQITVGVTGYKSEDTSFRFPTTLDSSFKVTQSTPNMEAEVLPQQVSVVEKIFLQLYAQLGGVVSQEQIQAAVNQAITEGKISNYDDTEINEKISSISEVTKSSNIFDLSKITLGKYWDVFEKNGTIWRNGESLKESTDYFVTDLIPVKNGDVIRSNKKWYNFVYFDSSKALSRCASGGNQAELAANEFTISGDLVAYVQFTYLVNVQDYNTLMITINEELPSSYESYYPEITTIKEEAITKFIRKRVDIRTTDTQEEILVKMLHAEATQNCDVYFETGTYNFDTVFDLMKSKYGYITAYELPIGGNCRYYFQGSTLIATKTSTDSNVIGNESLLGCRRSDGSYELYDGKLIANDMVYAVHDEAQGGSNPYVRKYKNMIMQYNTTSSTETLRKCIGGGTGLHGTVIIDSCVFITDYNTDVSYHGHEKDDATEFRLIVTNSYFSDKLRLDSLATNETAILQYSGNSDKTTPTSTTAWTVYAFNNETHS